MPRYSVTVTRTESITFELDAASPEDAEERYLMDGDEVGSSTGSLQVESVTALDHPLRKLTHPSEFES